MKVVVFVFVFLCVVPFSWSDFESTFTRVRSLYEEDTRGLRGMDPEYNTTQPENHNITEFIFKRVGFVVAHCFEEAELTFPWIYFANRSARVDIISPKWVGDYVASCQYVRANLWAKVDLSIEEALTVLYDVIVIPGGVWSSTVIRNEPFITELLQNQHKSGRWIAAVCSGTTVLINSGFVEKGAQLTGSPSIKIDLVNAGGVYMDVPVVVHKTDRIIWGRSPQGKDNLLFTEAIADALRNGL